MALKAGEMSLHHTRTVHGSASQSGGSTRMGFVVTYMTPSTQMIGPRTGATLVRGRDALGHFDLEEFDLPSISTRLPAAHEEAMRPFKARYLRGRREGKKRIG